MTGKEKVITRKESLEKPPFRYRGRYWLLACAVLTRLFASHPVYATGYSKTDFVSPCLSIKGAKWRTAIKPAKNDDKSSRRVALGFNFDFFGKEYKKVFINNNGNISFKRKYSDSTSTIFPNTRFDVIAPFFADVDTRRAGSVLYKKNKAENTFAVLWKDVGYFPKKANKKNTFQVVISDGKNADMGLGNNVCFCYGEMEWTTGGGDSSGKRGFGGMPAIVGANAGNGVDFNQIGRFDHPGDDYDGPFGTSGVNYLDFIGTARRDAICFSSAAVTTTNVPPTVDVRGGDGIEVNEGEAASNYGTYHDPDLNDVVSLSASVGTISDKGDGNWTWSYNTKDGPEDTQTVSINAMDSNGEVGTATFELTVNNVGPNANIDNDDFTCPPGISCSSPVADGTIVAREGELAVNTGTFNDPGEDTVTLTASIGEVVDEGNNRWTWTYQTTDGPLQTQTVRINVTDSDGMTDTLEFELTVTNVAPTVNANQDQVTVNEGEVATNDGTFVEPGSDSVTITASIGSVDVNEEDKTWTWTFLPDDGPDDSGTVTITATDKDGDSSSTTFDLTVNNVGPSIDVVCPPGPSCSSPPEGETVVTVNEGEVAISGGSFVNPGEDDLELTASIGEIVGAGENGWTWSYETTDGPSESQKVVVTAKDSDGDSSTAEFVLEVRNVAPKIVSLKPEKDGPFRKNEPGTLVATFTDPGSSHETYQVTWDWGDNSVDRFDDVGSTTSASHTYGEPGNYPVKVTVTDSDGDSSSEIFDCAVDMNCGKVEGKGWFNSPAGAYLDNPKASGRASFDFNVRYKKGASTPTSDRSHQGKNIFEFDHGGLRFEADQFEWLVVDPPNAQMMGTAKIKKYPRPPGRQYKFQMWFTANSIRVKLWYVKNSVETLVYDNEDEQQIGGGSIELDATYRCSNRMLRSRVSV